jgi:voltage-gated potassium channel Kch
VTDWAKPKPRDFLILPISPTRFAIERLSPKPIRIWNWGFRALLVVWMVGLYFTKTGALVRGWPSPTVWFFLWLLPFSRVNELALGFYQDAIQRFTGPASRTKTPPVERLKLLVWAYFEVAAQFGILYYCALPSGYFAKDFSSIIQALYFSVVTVTTVGYGDITPQKTLAQIVCMYELAVGFIVIVFALGSYLATSLVSAESSPQAGIKEDDDGEEKGN